MRIETVSEPTARRILSDLGLPLVFWATQHMDCGRHQATVCDYTHMPGPVRYAIGLYDREGNLTRRLNVPK